MPQSVKKSIWFRSAGGKNDVAGYFYAPEAVQPWCMVQVVHGMCEYVERYSGFADFLAENGVVLCGNDHLGHGHTAKDESELGHFREFGGRKFVLQDIWEMNRLAREAWPGLPLVMLGHSMGSFYARKYATVYPETIDALILSGTSGPVGAVGFGATLALLLAKMRGPQYRSMLLYKMAFGTYLDRIDQPKTIFDWISRDEETVAAYATDPLCSFRFTANGFHELFHALWEVSTPAWARQVPQELPVFLFSGDADPVGQYGEGVKQVHSWLAEAGVKDLRLTLYPGGRHEMLNETNRAAVYEDVLGFLREKVNLNTKESGKTLDNASFSR